ncbi:hypothetical protein NBRC110019_14730 [Neptunitalea chrysea]|uniref:DUF2971 domain-containing protein n=1 Tax=Neptunitalea chrysea TaxID=1647581 RepID=A0A9W6EW51_9FLAO|nr:DUF2971 domain-containing protein [Neptunitalea chrysea]GLB52433.1 hypothetical protein NBRC110019_14730 [Neptunitalea chrysea]
MLVYKYRGGNEEVFERDLKSLERNFFWATKFNNLNDPCETLINTEPFNIQTKVFSEFFKADKSETFHNFEKAFKNLFDVRKKAIGIYSLSKTFKDELLWAHYANSHRGFCIEYDLEKLINSYDRFEAYSFPVVYSKKPPEYHLKDMYKMDTKSIVKKIAGYKSVRWNYEQEHRIVTGYCGEFPYDPTCLKSIYFGLNMPEFQKSEMMDRLKGRQIQFLQMQQKINSYEFEAIKINDLKNEQYNYLKQIPSEVTGSYPISFKITSKEYVRGIKAVVEIKFEKTTNKESLEWLVHILNNEIFREVKRIFLICFIETEENVKFIWASCQWEIQNNKLRISID